ncbi:Rid family hydrolase [Orrella marina]|uniref:Uncharacterized protein n=1 Tax=Orrella marina TaxID=2163011 RepID=A0A2R4XIL3_9BURK|nr:Rid family hydrolase [Orrella marina]AWB33641.1 hypothetical protein DBV39_07890 [Orrella marina]
MEIIHAKGLPAPKGHYSLAILSNGLLFASGILPEELPASQTDSFERQVISALKRAKGVLEAGHSSMNQINELSHR